MQYLKAPLISTVARKAPHSSNRYGTRSNSRPNTYCGNLASVRIAWLVIVFGRSSEMYKNGNEASVSDSAISCERQLCLMIKRKIVGSRSDGAASGSAACAAERRQRGRRNQLDAGASFAGAATAAIVFISRFPAKTAFREPPHRVPYCDRRTRMEGLLDQPPRS